MKERWRPIPSFPMYHASSLGRVKMPQTYVRFVSKSGKECWRLKGEKIIAQQMQNCGYLIAHLWTDNRRFAKTVHSLIAEAFYGLRAPKMVVCHLNNCKTDNRLENICYTTQSENLKQMMREGRGKTQFRKGSNRNSK